MGRKQITTQAQDIKILVERQGEKTWKEISKEFGITISSARRAYKRAEESLKVELDEMVTKEVEETNSNSTKNKSLLSKIVDFFKSLFN